MDALERERRRHRRATRLVDVALQLSAERREVFLARWCGDDAELRRIVGEALREPGESGPVGGAFDRFARTFAAFDLSRLPSAIGGFRIVETLGEGGMGIVFRAEQAQPKREVALKVIRFATSDPVALRRFEREADALARLDHPHIASVIQSGREDTRFGALPYIAMELVQDAQSLTEHARARSLSRRALLELLLEVCDSVEHAHQRGVIHCDLKPANLLVDARGALKIVDFGIARLEDSGARVQSLSQSTPAIVGTLAYMSPEQLDGRTLDLDTRSDVYSLGVVAYELLAERLPHDLAGVPLHEAVRALRFDEPPLLGDLDPELRGDLEAIIARALEKDRDRRYGSAGALAADLRRHLSHEPVEARPRTALYQLQKYVVRHRAVVAAAAAIVIALVLGVFGTSWQAVRAEDAANRSRRMLEYVKFALGTPGDSGIDAQKAKPASSGAGSRSSKPVVSLSPLLERAASELPVRFPGEIDVQAELAHILGVAFYQIGQLDRAKALLETALDGRRRTLARGDSELSLTLAWLGIVCLESGQPKEAEPLLREAVDLRREFEGAEDSDTLSTASSLARVWKMLGRRAEAEKLYRDTLAAQRRVVPPKHPELLRTVNNLALLLLETAQYGEAEQLAREALDGFVESSGPEHSDTFAAINTLCTILYATGRYDEAEQRWRDLLPAQERVLTPNHPNTLILLANLGAFARNRGDSAEAERYLRRSLAGLPTLGPDHPLVAAVHLSLGLVLCERGAIDEAEAFERRALDAAQRAGPGSIDVALQAKSALGEVLRAGGCLDEAETLALEACAGLEARAGAASPSMPLLHALHGLGKVYCDQGRLEEAERVLTRALVAARSSARARSFFPPLYEVSLGRVLARRGDRQRAKDHLASSAAELAIVCGESHPDALRARQALFELQPEEAANAARR